MSKYISFPVVCLSCGNGSLCDLIEEYEHMEDEEFFHKYPLDCTQCRVCLRTFVSFVPQQMLLDQMSHTTKHVESSDRFA